MGKDRSEIDPQERRLCIQEQRHIKSIATILHFRRLDDKQGEWRS